MTIERTESALLLIDLQARLMPAIAESEAVIANARRLLAAAQMLDVPFMLTEQNPKGLGSTVPALTAAAGAGEDLPILPKQEFDACRVPGFFDRLPHRSALILAGCEAHVCVLQTALGLLAEGNHVYVVRDAVGSRRLESKATALDRLARHGVEIVTTEMVLFEWLETANHPRFREVVALIK